MNDTKSSTNIVYLNYITSSYETGNFESSSRSDSLCSIMKNNVLLGDYNIDVSKVLGRGVRKMHTPDIKSLKDYPKGVHFINR